PRYGRTIVESSGGSRRRAYEATSSVPLRLRAKAMPRYPALTRPVRTSAVSALLDARTTARSSVSGGFHRANRRSPRGDPSSETSATGSPHRADASSAGLPMVAEPKMNVGFDP